MPQNRSLELVYDTGALIAAARDDRRLWAIHARALQRRVRPIVPVGCLVEAWPRGRNANVARLLDGCEVEALVEPAAKRAGTLRRRALNTVGPVDAMVVESALRRRAAVVTSDRSDIEHLADSARRRIHIIDV